MEIVRLGSRKAVGHRGCSRSRQALRCRWRRRRGRGSAPAAFSIHHAESEISKKRESALGNRASGMRTLLFALLLCRTGAAEVAAFKGFTLVGATGAPGNGAPLRNA